MFDFEKFNSEMDETHTSPWAAPIKGIVLVKSACLQFLRNKGDNVPAWLVSEILFSVCSLGDTFFSHAVKNVLTTVVIVKIFDINLNSVFAKCFDGHENKSKESLDDNIT